MKLLILDNYDSFTYNLVHALVELGYEDQLEVHRNDKITLEEVDAFDKILLSPGPGIPNEAGIMQDLIKRYHDSKSILGICLGHQGIGEAFGATLYNRTEVLHGIQTDILLKDPYELLFKNLDRTIQACRYHSWAIESENLPKELIVTARDEGDEIMGIRHKQFDVRGLQFHPESILTPAGKTIIKNWIEA